MPPEATEVTTAEISAALDNSSETTGQTEPQNSDNSENVETQEPDNLATSTTDNQDNSQEEAADKPKFDNLDAALKGYANLEKKLGEQSNELGKLRKQAEIAKQYQDEVTAIAQHYGFNNADDFKNALEKEKYDTRLAAYEADLYSQYLDKCEFPDEMQKLLLSYRNNPNKETLELIEADFPVEIIKQVASAKALTKQQLDTEKEAQAQAAYEEQLKSTAVINQEVYE